MKEQSKVLWYEGMTLDPHHFQQWDRFHQSTLNYRIRSLEPYYWGVSALSIEKEALANGMMKLVKATGVTPDGYVFNLPESAPLPGARVISDHFQTTQDSLSVYLALPGEKPQSKNAELDHKSDSENNIRFSLEEVEVVDENSGLDQRRIGVAKPNFQIRFSDEMLEDFSVLKIAEIVRSSDNEFVLNDNFIPPTLNVNASDNLQAILRKIVELFVARGNALRKNRRFTAGGQLDVGTKEIAAYGQLSAISTFLPLVHQYHEGGKTHPFEVYRTLLAAAGNLTCYSNDTSIGPTSFPIYDHDNLSQIYHTIEQQIRQLLGEIVVEKNYQEISLNKQSENMFQAQIDAKLIEQSDFYLKCTGEYDAQRLRSELSNMLRVASPEMIAEVLSTATRALPASYSADPPPGLPPEEDAHFILLEKRGPFWDAIKREKAVAVYVPSEFNQLDMELIAVVGKS